MQGIRYNNNAYTRSGKKSKLKNVVYFVWHGNPVWKFTGKSTIQLLLLANKEAKKTRVKLKIDF